MIQSIRIKNFQAHEDLLLKLDPNVTTIVGPTDVGKSDVVRALRWLCFNRPSGQAFVRDGADRAEVIVRVDEKRIRRSRGRRENTYKIDGERLEAFGNDVPSAVSDLLRVGELNFQRQHDSPFWFNETAGEVSRRLNKIVNLEMIDRAMSSVKAMSRRASLEAELVDEEVEATRRSVRRLRCIKDIDVELGQIEGMQAKLSHDAESATQLAELVEGVVNYVDRHRTASEAAIRCSSVLELGQRWEGTQDKAQSLLDCIEEAIDADRVAKAAIPSLGELESVASKASETEKRAKVLCGLLGEIEQAVCKIDERCKEWSLSQAKLKSTMGSSCPLCGAKIRS